MTRPPNCERKIRFNTEPSALKQVARMARKGRGYTRAYECLSCGGWHLTSKRRLVWVCEQSTPWRYLMYRIRRWGRP